jgi:hypothetical protein
MANRNFVTVDPALPPSCRTSLGHLAQIEVDGVWYSPAGTAGISPRVEKLRATKQITNNYQTDLFALDTEGNPSTLKRTRFGSGRIQR